MISDVCPATKHKVGKSECILKEINAANYTFTQIENWKGALIVVQDDAGDIYG